MNDNKSGTKWKGAHGGTVDSGTALPSGRLWV